ncbi:hypothetical protein FPANT_13036 [Fusarium pseudoanthophilum]|uniref:Uncharacterized protein n=1 Tax=Fusarium pseudoanthophilum TaxID=48495 RepID=A0A8H5NMY8_9HYPO|nr:hypothetical protein FPANT_13036 [Fusarium pseudoanthophilum]
MNAISQVNNNEIAAVIILSAGHNYIRPQAKQRSSLRFKFFLNFNSSSRNFPPIFQSYLSFKCPLSFRPLPRRSSPTKTPQNKTPSHHPQTRSLSPKSSPINPIQHPIISEDDQTVGFVEEMTGGATTKKTEHSPQQHYLDLFYTYWDAYGGHDKATYFDWYHVFRILRSRRKASRRVEFLV